MANLKPQSDWARKRRASRSDDDEREAVEWESDYRDFSEARPQQNSSSSRTKRQRVTYVPAEDTVAMRHWRPEWRLGNDVGRRYYPGQVYSGSLGGPPPRNPSDEDEDEPLTKPWQGRGFILSQHHQVRHASVTSKSRGPKRLPDWVHPKWAKVFLPTLAHALYVSKDPFEEFKPSSPTFIATVQKIFKLVYSHATYDITDDILVEVSQRLIAKKSRIASAVMQEVKDFFEQPQYINPDQINVYARWALEPDGPAFHETPTPISCEVERSHEDYIPPKGTFQSPFISKVAKHFLLQAKGSVLDPISASNPPKGLFGLLLVSVERAFLAFRSGSFIKPKAKFSHENYWTQLETYISHLDTLSRRSWEKILHQAKASDVNMAPIDERADASLMSKQRRNLYIPES